MVQPKKDSRWKQKDPVDQLTALLQSLEGNFDNLKEGRMTKEGSLLKASCVLGGMKRLVPFLKEPSRWNETNRKERAMDYKFEMNEAGEFRIHAGKESSNWVGYGGVAKIETEGKALFGVSEAFAGILPTECVFTVQELPTECSPISEV